MHDLPRFTLNDMTACNAVLRGLSAGAESMAEVASRIVRYLHEHLVNEQIGDKVCASVRCYKIHPYEGLMKRLAIHTSPLKRNS